MAYFLSLTSSSCSPCSWDGERSTYASLILQLPIKQIRVLTLNKLTAPENVEQLPCPRLANE